MKSPAAAILAIPVAMILLILAAIILPGQRFPHEPLSIVADWTHKHLLYPVSNNPAVMARIMRDPRYVHNWYIRHPEAWWPQYKDKNKGLHPDWSVPIGGNVGNQSAVAKFNFDVTAAPDCTNDYVVTGVQTGGNGPGSATNANIIAVNKLYSGTIAGVGTGPCGAAPAVYFAYNVGPGWVVGSVSLSMDGTKLAFNEANGTSSYFHVLTWKANQGTAYSAPVTLAHPSPTPTPGPGVDYRFALPNTSNTTPFVDYYHDTAYVTAASATSGCQLHKFSGVFKGTPKEVTTTGWPVSIAETDLSSPVLDQVTMRVFFRSNNTGNLYYVSDPAGGTPSLSTALNFDSHACCAPHGPIVDSTNQVVYVYDGGGNSAYGQSLVGQTTTSLTNLVTVTVGHAGVTGHLATLNGKAPDFNNNYYNGINSTVCTATNGYATCALMYTVGNGSTQYGIPALYGIGFTGTVPNLKMNSTTEYGPITVATVNTTYGIQTFGVTEFYNTNLAKEFLFTSVTGNCLNAAYTTGCIMSIDSTSAFPTAAGVAASPTAAAINAANPVIVDNNSNAIEASSIYYVDQGSTQGGTASAAASLIKSTQAGLK